MKDLSRPNPSPLQVFICNVSIIFEFYIILKCLLWHLTWPMSYLNAFRSPNLKYLGNCKYFRFSNIQELKNLLILESQVCCGQRIQIIHTSSLNVWSLLSVPLHTVSGTDPCANLLFLGCELHLYSWACTRGWAISMPHLCGGWAAAAIWHACRGRRQLPGRRVCVIHCAAQILLLSVFWGYFIKYLHLKLLFLSNKLNLLALGSNLHLLQCISVKTITELGQLPFSYFHLSIHYALGMFL